MVNKKKTIKKIKEFIDKYSKILGLTNVKIDYSIIKPSGNYCAIANRFQVDPNSFIILFSEEHVNNDLEDTVLHELLHLLLYDLRDTWESMWILSNMPKKIEELLDCEEHKVIDKLIKIIRK